MHIVDYYNNGHGVETLELWARHVGFEVTVSRGNNQIGASPGYQMAPVTALANFRGIYLGVSVIVFNHDFHTWQQTTVYCNMMPGEALICFCSIHGNKQLFILFVTLAVL